MEGTRLTRCQIASRRDDPVQVDALTPQQVRRVCTADALSELASNPHTVGADPAGLAWLTMCCAVWHGSIIGACRCTLIYLIIIGAVVLSCTASGVVLVSGICAKRPGAGRRSSVSQAVQWLVVWVLYRWRWSEPNRRKSVCKALCNVLWRGRYNCIYGTKRAVNDCMGLYCSRAK